jgi:hypothetical protein
MKTTAAKNTVKIYRDIPHYLPCSISNKRIKGWQMIKRFNGGYIEVRAWETVNITDLIILFAAVKAFQDNTKDIEEGEIYKDSNDNMQRKSIIVRVKLKMFSESYLGIHDYKAIENSLKRLTSMQQWHHQNNGDVFQVKYLLDFAVKEEDGIKFLTLMLNKAFYDKCLTEKWIYNFQKLQEIKGQAAKALHIYIAAQNNTAMYQDTLERNLGLDDRENNNRAILNKSFMELERVGLIIYHGYRKTEKGYLFSWQKL